MNKTFLAAWLFMLACSFSLFGQVPTGNDSLLSAAALSRQKTFYSLEEALINPAEVYKLSLTDQKIKELSPEIGKLTNLQWLSLSENKLKELPEELGNCTKLEFLTIFDNKLKSMPEVLKQCRNLRVLYLGQNKMVTVPEWVAKLKKLVRFDLSRNRITPLEAQYIRNMMPPRVDVTL